MASQKIIRSPAAAAAAAAPPVNTTGNIAPIGVERIAWPWPPPIAAKDDRDDHFAALSASLAQLRKEFEARERSAGRMYTHSADVQLEGGDNAMFRILLPRPNLFLSAHVIGAPIGPQGVQWSIVAIDEGSVQIAFINEHKTERRVLKVAVALWLGD